ncbi:ABC transporter permease subunit [Paenibacillus sp. LMG 31458]|uniref:ABC transporter permease subunit n=1 Tax=Paenibacillus phytorum TaxID=2654977 RepID=A0ABX1Y727_9BACL|nr:ABC transporter permease [Paenibacillus phytorum]NOU76224.1 ABC transporter permease subunit [Paenibacillus phytorum]
MPIWIIAKYEILRFMRMRYVLIIQFLMPLLLIFILGSALSGAFKMEDRTLKPVKVDVVQSDSGVLSAGFKSFLSTPEIMKIIQPMNIQSRDEAVKRLKSGDSDFALIIPSDFSSCVLEGKEAEWEMILGQDYGQNLTAKMTLRSFLDQVNYMQSAIVSAGPGAAELLQKQDSDGSFKPISEASSHVRLGKLTSSNSNYTAMQYYTASMLVMFLLYSGMGAALGLQGEKERHTLSRLNAMPIHEYQILLGKIIGSIFSSIVQAGLVIGATILFYGVDWGNDFFHLFLVCLLIIVASMSLAILIMLAAKSSKAISTTFQMIILVMTFLSGGFTPLPEGLLQRMGEFTLNHWAMQSMFRIMLGSDASIIGHHISILACISGGLLLLTLIVYRKAGYHE